MEMIKKEQEQKEIATLGDGQVFIKRSPTGAIKAISSKVTLKEEEGQLVDIQGKVMITAGGYIAMNRIAGCSIVTPKFIELPSGEKVPNPYMVYGEKGDLQKIWVKKSCVGFTPSGNLMVTSSSLVYDVQMYFLRDLMKKVTYDSKAGRLCPEGCLTEHEKKTGMWFRIDGMMGVWVNFNDPNIIKTVNTFIEAKNFAERKAQTIAERNAMKKHSAFGKIYVKPQGQKGNYQYSVNVVGWTHDLTEKDFERLAEMEETGQQINMYKGMQVDIISGADELADEDLKTEIEEEEETKEEDFRVEAVETEFEEVSVGSDKEKESILNFIYEGMEVIGEETVNKIIKKVFGNKQLNELNLKQLEMIKKMIDKEASKQF